MKLVHFLKSHVQFTVFLVLALLIGGVAVFAPVRSRTQGRGSFTMHFDHYEEVAKNLVDKILGIIYQ